MKIRTDFVTNSSSSCTAEVRIDNPALAKLLDLYCKQYGIKKRSYGVQLCAAREGKVYAFYAPEINDDSGEFWEEVQPRKLSQVLNSILVVIQGANKGADFEGFQEALLQHREEIENDYAEVFWKTISENGGEFFPYDRIYEFLDKDDDSDEDDLDECALDEYSRATETFTFSYNHKDGEQYNHGMYLD